MRTAMITQSKRCATDGLSVTNLMDRLEFWTERRPRNAAYTFHLEDGTRQTLTYLELTQQARRVAAMLQGEVNPGDRVLLLYPPGLEFIAGFLGCIFAGVIGVPTCYPKPRRPTPRLSAIVRDAQASAVLTTDSMRGQLDWSGYEDSLADLPWHATDRLDGCLERRWRRPCLGPDDIAMLQYTSGSTSDPKGVILSHSNLLHNLEAIRRGFNLDFYTDRDDDGPVGVFWLPAYHDMGLIGGILTPLYVGGHSCLMSPRWFMQRPARWLAAISQTGARSAAPELCLRFVCRQGYGHAAQQFGLKQLAFGILRGRAGPGGNVGTVRRRVCGRRLPQRRILSLLWSGRMLAAGGRRRRARGPHGQVDPARLAAGTPRGQRQWRSGPGHPTPGGLRQGGLGSGDRHRRPVHSAAVRPGRVGEIWIKGPSNAQGYWNRPRETDGTFRARLADTHEGPYLRTGDLGFQDQDNLYVTGRWKEVVILRGRNHYPQDIELTAGQAHPALNSHRGAAFSVDAQGEECLVVVHEVGRSHREEDWASVVHQIRRSIVEHHEIDVHAVGAGAASQPAAHHQREDAAPAVPRSVPAGRTEDHLSVDQTGSAVRANRQRGSDSAQWAHQPSRTAAPPGRPDAAAEPAH